jgi:predicted nucleic acid-binding Zn ribbon protein
MCESKCNFCLSPIKTTNRFCDRSCAATFNNLSRAVFKLCLNCDTQITYQKKYCSTKCQQDYQYKDNINKWLKGELSGTTDNGYSDFIKRYLIEKHGDKCQRCGWCKRNPITNKVPIQLEHIDGNWQNNRPENLILLCPNCHSLTPTFGALNKGNGRGYRYKKYNEYRQTIRSLTTESQDAILPKS